MQRRYDLAWILPTALAALALYPLFALSQLRRVSRARSRPERLAAGGNGASGGNAPLPWPAAQPRETLTPPSARRVL